MSITLNEVVIAGRLARDPEVRTVGEHTVARISVAVDKRLSKDTKEKMKAEGKQTADFIPCNAWDHNATFLQNYAGKGANVAITGTLETRTFQDKQTGQNRFVMEVRVNNVTLASGTGVKTAQPAQTDGDMPQPAGDELDIASDDLPF